jgi:hypothetical protein
MRTGRVIWRYALSVALTLVPVFVRDAAATPPFSSDYTYRLSKKITAIGSAPTYDRTYQTLAADSKQLTFQELASGRVLAAFASQDPTIDNLAGYGTNRASDINNYFQVYWMDKYAELPAVCVSCSSGGTTGDADSVNPIIGGPTGEEGRYVAYESDSTNLYSFPGVAQDAHQIYVHDRKYESSFLSSSNCDAANNSGIKQGGNGPSYLWQLSDDGRKILMSSQARNMIDNLNPTCTDGGNVIDLFVRDGGNCYEPGTGACYTSLLYDDLGYHAGENTVVALNNHSYNARMSPDASVVVFDTQATNPVRYNPDTRGFRDIYYHMGNDFSLISQAQIPFCSATGVLQPLRNDNGAANGDSFKPSVDSTGRYVVFQSTATDLVVRDPNPAMVCGSSGAPHPVTFEYVGTNSASQIYLFDKLNTRVEMISLAYNASASATPIGGNGASTNARISKDGRFVVFESVATNLMATTTTSHKNIFLYDRVLDKTDLVTPGTGGTGINADADITHVSGTGFTIAFQTRASDVVVNDADQGGAIPTCGAQACQQVYLAQSACQSDTDGDLIPDCADLCPNDRNKTEAGFCGCGKLETDTDNDFSPDCIDLCDNDATKTVPGSCGCGVSDADSDFDGVADCIDQCPSDASKTTSAGLCGCGVADTDTDGDGSPDCVDKCPADSTRRSATSGCACSALKENPGVCGCNVADVDSNGNGAVDCLDPTAASTPSTAKYDVSKVLLGQGKSVFTLRLMAQKFSGKVSYTMTLKRGTASETKTSTSPFFTFKNLRKGNYTVTYTVSVGSGASKVTSKISSVVVSVK